MAHDGRPAPGTGGFRQAVVPAYQAFQNVGEAGLRRATVEQAQGRLRDDLPIWAEINVVGYLARKPEGAESA